LCFGDTAKDQLLAKLKELEIPFKEAKRLPGQYGGFVDKGAVGKGELYQIVPSESFDQKVLDRLVRIGGEKGPLARMYSALTKTGVYEVAFIEDGKKALGKFSPYGDLTPEQRGHIKDNNFAALGKDFANQGIMSNMPTPNKLLGVWKVSIVVGGVDNAGPGAGHVYIKYQNENNNTYFAELYPNPEGWKFGMQLQNGANAKNIFASRTLNVWNPWVVSGSKWTVTHNCGGYAANAWQIITGEKLSLTGAGQLLPRQLGVLIDAYNENHPADKDKVIKSPE